MAVGSVQRAAGRGGRTVWRARLDAPKDHGTGRRRQLMQSFATKRAAVAWLAEQRVAQATGTFVAPSRLTLGAYLDDWLAGRDDVREATRIAYASLARSRIRPALGAARLQDLRQPEIAAFLRRLTAEGLAPATVRSVRAILGQAFDDARREGVIATNPVRELRARRRQAAQGEDERPRFWSGEQARTFLAHVAGDRDAAVWRLALASGMRIGELLALRWADVDLAHETLTVRRTLTRTRRGFVASAPKTRSGVRAIPLDERTVAALRGQRLAMLELRARNADVWHDQDLVFPRADGTSCRPQTMRRHLAALCGRVDVPALTPHGLRHTMATLSLAAGVAEKVVSERLGHGTIAMTADLYQHVTPELQRAAAAALGEALG